MKIRKTLLRSGCLLALCLAATGGAEAKKVSQCASPAEVTAMQVSAVQQELMDAALTCGESALTNYNAFQTSYGPELRRSDKTLLLMFHRVLGFKKGDAAYNLYKTELASKAELRRLHGHQDFCAAANLAVAAALAPDRPSLNDFVSGIQVKDIGDPSVETCKMEVAVTLQGVMAGPDIVPKPNPLRVAAVTRPPPPSAPPVLPAVAPPVEPQKPVQEQPKQEKKPGWLSDLWN